MRRLGLIAVLLSLGGVALGLSLALARSGSGSQPEPASPAATAAGEGLATAAAFAPLVVLHPKERFFPAAPEDFVARSRLLFFERAQADVVADSPEPGLLGAGSYRRGGFSTRDLTRPYALRRRAPRLASQDGFVLDLGDESHCRGAGEGLGCSFTRVPVYYQYSPGRFVTYWFFYPYSAPVTLSGQPSYTFGHEGDWERLAVLLDEGDRPVAVAYYQHEAPPQLVTWRSASEVVDGRRRPVVYAALGTHASYPRAGAKTVTVGYLSGPNSATRPQATFVESRAPGLEWRTWLDLRDVRQPWFGYGGGWGNRGRFPFTTGPLGPSPWKAPAPCTRRIGQPCTDLAQPHAQVQIKAA